MKWGVQFANTGVFAKPEMARTLAELAEEAGFESLWAIEHVVVPAGYQSRYPFSADGQLDSRYFDENADLPDPLIWLSFIASATQRIRLATGILILPQRNPVILAKETATLDALSGGRFSLGVGVGWLEEEFQAIGVPFEQRGARCEEYIAALRTLWRDAEPTYRGRFVSFKRAKLHPKPAQTEGIPIVIGGHGAVAARRAGRIGDGFFPAIYPASDTLTVLPPLITEMRRAALEAGRDPSEVEITSGGARTVEATRPFVDLGVARLVIRARSTAPDALREELLRFGDEVIAKTR